MKRKKYMLPFFGLLFLIIVSVTFLIILMTNTNKETTDVIGDESQLISPVPTKTVTPIVTVAPTAAPEIITELYPAYDIVDNVKKYGYIDKAGAFVIEPTFEAAGDFHEGVALVTLEGKSCVIDEGGNILFVNDNLNGVFHNGLVTFTSWREEDNTTLYGYLDTEGKVVVNTKYILATDFNEDGTAYVQLSSGKYALIDKTGKELETYELDPKYDNPWSLQDGYLITSNSDSTKYGVINIKGEVILKQEYSGIEYLGNGLFAVKKPGLGYEKSAIAKQAIFNQAGEQLSEYQYYDLYYYNVYISATDDTSTFFVGLDGKKVTGLPSFEGRGILSILGDVISANIDGEQFYCTLDNNIFWQLPDSYALTDSITIRKIKFKPNLYVLVNYPQVEGLENSTIQSQINAQLKSAFTDSRKDLTSKDLLNVDDTFSTQLMNNLLIVAQEGYEYSFGAAHGMPIMNYFFIDINTGVFYELKDLFLAESDYKTKINDLIKAEITAASTSEESMYFPENFKGIADNQYFRLEEDALIIYFYPYDIAAYAAGFPEFTIPFDDIIDYIDIKGAFWNCFHE